MNLEQIVLLVIGSLSGLVIIVGSSLPVVYRKNASVKSTLPYLNLPLGLAYLVLQIYITLESVFGKVICPIYMWSPYIFVTWLWLIYSLKCWRLYALSTVARLQMLEVTDFGCAPPDPMRNIDLTERNEETGFKIETFKKKVPISRLDHWIYRHPRSGKSSRLLKLFAFLTLPLIAIPLAVMVTNPVFTTPTYECDTRSWAEVVGYSVLVFTFYCVFGVTLYNIRGYEPKSILKSQLKVLALVWMCAVALWGMIAFLREYSLTHTIFLYNIANTVILLLPFSVDAFWPLYRALKERINRDQYQRIQFTFEELLTCKNQSGWEAIANFMNEHTSPVDLENNILLMHGLHFVKEFLDTKKDMIGNRKSVAEEELDNDLIGLVMLTWLKYLHVKGEFTWSHTNENAPMLILLEDIKPIKEKMEITLKNLGDFCGSPDEQKKAGTYLREVYQVVLKEVESAVYEKFKKSVQFQNFITKSLK